MTLTPVLVFTQDEGVDGSSFNDGAACAARAALLGVAKKVSVDGGTNYVDADEEPYPHVIAGADVYYKFVIANVGTVTLTNIELSDPDYDLSGCVVPDTLAPNESFECMIGPFAAGADMVDNTVTVTADDANIGTGEDPPNPEDPEYDGPDSTETDSATYFGVVSAVDVEKEVRLDPDGEWMDADTAPGLIVMMGSTVTYRITVTNVGNTPLTGVALDDTDYDLSGCIIPSPLAVDESYACEVGPVDVEFLEQVNTVTATGEDAELGEDAEDTDSAYYTAYYWAFTPGLWKNHAGEDSHNAKKGRRGNVSRDAWVLTAFDHEATVGGLFDALSDEDLYDCVIAALDQDVPKLKGNDTFAELTLLQALDLKGDDDVVGAISTLLRTAVATVLNASFHEEGNGGTIPENFPYTTEEVITALAEALCQEDLTDEEYLEELHELQEHFTEINEGLHYIDWPLLDP